MRVFPLQQICDGCLFVEGHTEYFCDGLLTWEPLVFVIQTHLSAQQLNRIFAIRPVHNGEGRGEIDPTAHQTHNLVGEGMTASACDSLASIIYKQAGPKQHPRRSTAFAWKQKDRSE